MIFDAIEAVAHQDAEGNTVIGRQALRDALYATSGLAGITGNISCNELGDCADPKIAINQIEGGAYNTIFGGGEEAMEEGEAMEDEAVTPTGEEGTPYKIGFISAVTGPGSSLGVPERNTAEMIAEQLTAEGGIVGPDGITHQVEIIVLDSESNPDTAAANANRLIVEEEVDILVGGSLSGNALAMVPIASENETPMVGMASAGAIVKDPDTGEVRHWIFKIPHENNQVSQAMVQVLEANGVTSVCHLYENSGYGQDTLAQATAVFEEAGIEILYSDSFERTDTEFPQVVSVQGAGCEAVTVGAIPPGAPLVTQRIGCRTLDASIVVAQTGEHQVALGHGPIRRFRQHPHGVQADELVWIRAGCG
jgi:ABC-type branched-subunit amino acid transport system substrate-binding protein